MLADSFQFVLSNGVVLICDVIRLLLGGVVLL